MKKIYLFVFIVLSILPVARMVGMSYDRASNDDIDGVLQLINTEACNDSSKIVIVPERFRKSYVEDAIEKGRLFVVKNSSRVIGYKKLFCITDPNELNYILTNELRCVEADAQACAQGCPVSDNNGAKMLLWVSPTFEFEKTNLEMSLRTMLSSTLKSTFIYTGSDFTCQKLRGCGVNKLLTQEALESISEDVIADIKSKNSRYVALVYGLTKANALGISGDHTDILGGRTRSICTHFYRFCNNITRKLECASDRELLISRYDAFKPSFDPQSLEYAPLPDSEAIPGYGYVLAYPLSKKN